MRVPRATGATEPPVTVTRTQRPPVPHRYRGPHGLVALMDCRACRAPFRLDEPVPRDRLCVDCRPADNQLALFEVDNDPTTHTKDPDDPR